MDFEDRDDFNHLLLQIAAFLGLLIAISGVIFLGDNPHRYFGKNAECAVLNNKTGSI